MDKYLLIQQESERLFYRKVTMDDFDPWLEFFNTPEAIKYLFLPKLTAEENCKYWFNKILDRYKNDTGGLMALIEKSSGAMVGQCGLLVQEVDNIEELEIGYSIFPKYWGSGFATEAAIKCREYAFSNKFSDSLISIIHVDNEKSKSVARRNGMTLDKETLFRDFRVEIFRINKYT
jgi:RimJ/RimL family protein N-acetyltransferase